MTVHKPKYSQSIIQKTVGTAEFPEALLTKLFKENNSAWGMSVRLPSGIDIEKFPKMGDPDAEIREFKGILNNIKQYPAMIVLHSFPKEFDEDEIQPWPVIRDSKGKPILAVAIEGDFPKYATSENGYSEAFEFLDKWLGPKLEAAYTLCGNSPAKLFEFIKTQQFNTDFVEQFGHRAVLSFMPNVGDPFVVEKNDIGVTGIYGDVSNAYGYTEPVPAKEEPKPVATKPRSKYASSDDEFPKTDPEPAPVKVAPSGPAVAPPAPKDPVEKVALEMVEQDWTPPLNVHGKKLKALIREMNDGVLPSNWESRPTIRIKVQTKVKSMADLDKTAASPNLKTVVDSNGIYNMPVLDAKRLTEVNEFIKKHLGDGSAVISDPTKAAAEIQQLAKFTDVVKGFGDITELNKVRTSFIFSMAKQHYELAGLAIIQQREEINRLNAMLESVTAPGEKKDGDTTAPQPEPQPMQQPEPEKKTGTGGGRSKYI